MRVHEGQKAAAPVAVKGDLLGYDWAIKKIHHRKRLWNPFMAASRGVGSEVGNEVLAPVMQAVRGGLRGGRP
jgi:hypothetical protein